MRLRTFGGLWIEAEGAQAAPEPRKRWLALLAILAASGPKGMSRDRLLGILWAEADEERARHALSQTLYSLRRDLRGEPVIGATELRLDPNVISSDVGEAQSALTSGNRKKALELYTAPFLEGFYLEAAPEFERWAEEQRTRLSSQMVAAGEALAKEATAAGNPAETSAAWLRLTELDPLRARFATSYMSALAAQGDRAGALAHARKHEEAVRRELDTGPDPEVVELAKRLRREKPAASSIPADISAERPTPQAERAAAAPSTTSSPPAPWSRPRNVRWILIGSAVAIVALAIALLVRPAPQTTPMLAVGVIRDVATRDSSSGVLTDMLATNLGRVRGLQVVANSRLFELMRPGADTARGAFSDAARRAGAREILEGEISYARQGGLQLDLRRLELRSGVVKQGYRVHGLDRYALVDSATAAVARDFSLTAPGSAIAEVSTSSPMAYRFYEEGLRSFYQYDGAAAFRLMQSALKEDSTFAIAAYYAWRARGGDVGDPYLDLAVRLAPKAPDRERLLILGHARSYREDPAAVFPTESLAIRFPTDPNGQWLRGIMASTFGDYAVSIEALNRAIALDSAASFIAGEGCRACQSLLSMIQVYESWDSAGAAERTARRWLRLQPRSTNALLNLGDAIARQGRWNEVEPVLRAVDSLEPGKRDWRNLEMYSLIRRENYQELDREAQAALRDPSQEMRIDALWYWIIGLRNQGRLRDARMLLQGSLPDGSSFRLPVQDAIRVPIATVAFESKRYDPAIATYHQLVEDNWKNPYPGHRARGTSWNLTLEATAVAAAGDTAKLREMADSVEKVGRHSLFARSPRLHHFLRGLLLAQQGRHAEAVPEFQRAIISWSDGFTRINFEMARSLIALGKPAEAVAVLRPALRGAVDASNLYLTRTEIHELLAQAFAQAGQRDSAAVHYRAVVRAWERADSAFVPRLQAARQWLASH